MSWRRRMGAAIANHLSSRNRTAALPFESGRRRSLRSGVKPPQSEGTSATCGSHQEHHRKYGQEHEEQDLRDPDRRARYAGKAEQSGDQTEDQERQCPMQHGNLPLSVSDCKRSAASCVPLTVKCWSPSEKGEAREKHRSSASNPYTDYIRVY